ncbi:MAG TPA: zf-HC2 domain-containing protein [bacterium]|nr:zf-HC2 domain-containing protein [bacterium]
MHDTRCNLNEIFIEQFADGELDLKESSEISAHLENCPECRKKYDEIKLVKRVITGIKEREVLSVIEKEGFISLIDRAVKPSFATRIGTVMKSHGFSVGFSFFSFASFIFLFSYYIYTSDKENSLVVNEIISAHRHSLPDEFNGTENTEAELQKNFKVDKKLMKKLAKISPVVRGRYTSIAANPVAKINLEGIGKNKGTLFMSKKNHHLKELFDDKDCVVKTHDEECKARHFQEKENDLVYWENQDNDYIFITESSGMMAEMVQLISSDY